jgi:polyisoprenoid-binding protein YceI
MKKFLFLLLAVLSQQAAFAGVYTFTPDKGTVEFHAKGKPALLKITGKGTGVGGALKNVDGKLSGDMKFDLNSLDTGIELRNDHMKHKYLEVQTYPYAVLHFTDFTFPKSTDQFEFTGDLEIKNVKKPIKGTAKIEKAAEGSKLSAEFSLKITDYPIGVPNYLGVTIAEDVTVQVSATFSEEADIASNLQPSQRK